MKVCKSITEVFTAVTAAVKRIENIHYNGAIYTISVEDNGIRNLVYKGVPFLVILENRHIFGCFIHDDAVREFNILRKVTDTFLSDPMVSLFRSNYRNYFKNGDAVFKPKDKELFLLGRM